MNILSRILAGSLALALVLGGLVLPASAFATALTPVINAPANNSIVTVGTPVTFTASATGGNAPYVYLWNFGDGTTAPGQSFTKVYTQSGARVVSMVAVDFFGNRATATINLTVNNAQSALEASINSPANNAAITAGTPVTFTASATGGNAPYVYTWNFGDSTTAAGQSFTKTYTATGTKTVVLTVTDFSGNTDTASINVVVGSGNTGDTTPPTAPTIITSSHAVNATSTDTSVDISWTASTDNVGVVGYSFLWDNNSATTPDNTVDSTNTSLTQTLSLGTWWFHIKALDAAGNASSVTHYGPITITSGSTTTDPLTISNIRVTDITQTSAVIRWTTNRAANSRVIYDTVSHPDISGESAPNFGYQFSTATSDNDPKVIEHAVTVSGLSANTAYFFRVLSQE